MARELAVLAVAGLTVVALGVRFLPTHGLLLDEATSVRQATLPFGAMLADLRHTDVHPPLYFSVLWAAVRVLGTSELAVRLPSILAGAALVPLLYVAGRDIYDRRAGLVAAAFGIFAPFAFWYAQEARMYAFFMVFALMAIWAQVRALREGQVRDWALYALATAALLWNQYFSLLLVGVQQAAFLAVVVHRARRRQSTRRLLIGWLVATAAVAVVVVPLIPFAVDQFAANQAAGKGFGATEGNSVLGPNEHLTVYRAITAGLWAIWGYHSAATMALIAALWPLAMLLTLALLGRGRSAVTALLVACALVPAGLLFALAELKPFLFEPRYLIGAVPALLLLVARAVTTWTPSRGGRILATGVIAATLVTGLVDQQVARGNPQDYDFRAATHFVVQRAQPGDVVLYEPGYLRQVVRYYGDGRLPDNHGLELHLVVRGQRHARVFVIASYEQQPQVQRDLGAALYNLKHERRLVKRVKLSQVTVWEFA